MSLISSRKPHIWICFWQDKAQLCGNFLRDVQQYLFNLREVFGDGVYIDKLDFKTDFEGGFVSFDMKNDLGDFLALVNKGVAKLNWMDSGIHDIDEHNPQLLYSVKGHNNIPSCF